MKSLIEKAFFLKKISIFADLDLDLLLAIAEKLDEDDYDMGEKIFTYGQSANRIYFVKKGIVQICDQQMRPLSEVTLGDYFGEESLFNERPRGYTAFCKTSALFFTLSRSHLLSILSECPSVAIALIQAYSQQVMYRNRESYIKKPGSSS